MLRRARAYSLFVVGLIVISPILPFMLLDLISTALEWIVNTCCVNMTWSSRLVDTAVSIWNQAERELDRK